MQDTSNDVENIIDYYDSCDDDVEFVHNVKIMLDEEYIPYKYIGRICYLPQGYAKHIEREIARAERNKLNHIHYGEVGKRYKGVHVESVSRVATYQTMYGTMNVYDIVIDGDIVLTWKTKSYIDDNYSTIDFTVKAHDEYKGCLRTEVSRCKVA